MKNNTKVRLHLSKQLFETLTKQVLAEAKMKKEALGGYTEVKMPKANKSAEKMTDKMKKMEEVNAQADTNKMQKMDEKMSSKEKMAKGLYKEEEMEEGSINESEILTQLQNFLTTQIGGDSSASVGSILAGLAGIGVSAGVIDQLHKWWEKKNPGSFKKAQGVSGAMDQKVGGNQPGQGRGVDTSKTFGPK